MSDTATPVRSATATEVRAWAADNGFDVAGRRGRLSTEVFAAYDAAFTPSGKPRKGQGRQAGRRVIEPAPS